MADAPGTGLSRQKAKAFADKWSGAKSEKQLAQSFWSDFFHHVIEVEDLLNAGIEFEYPIKNKETGIPTFVDVLWGGVVLIEHKSAGKNLDVAEVQARGYLSTLPAKMVAPFIIISDFAKIRIIDVYLGQTVEFALSELPDNLHRIEAVFRDYNKNATIEEVTADADAVALMSELFIALEKAGYDDHAVSVFLVRVLFLLFGDDTAMWKRDAFRTIIENSRQDGVGLGGRLGELFARLDDEKRLEVDAELEPFPYVNGGLFSDDLTPFNINEEMRDALLKACAYEWSKISPAIFGAMFQNIKSVKDRRALGTHYTSEANILKVIRPLFLDDYLDRLRKGWDDRNALRRLRVELGKKRYLDAAAGSGNFLIITYQRLRDIEHKIIARLIELEGKVTQSGVEGIFGLQIGLDGTIGLSVHVEQFHAIEYEEWSSQIATVAMFLTDHQANLALEELTGAAPNRFPLTHAPTIRHGNALRIDWTDVCPIDDDTIILGNPPFYGSHLLSPEQKLDQQLVWAGISGAGDLDYVASWYLVAARHMEGTKAKAAFVSTNSITQGQQPPLIWRQLAQLGMGIDFAHRTFEWWNDATARASVHCVIIGFSANDKPTYRPLWSYATVKSEPELVRVRNINAYLLDAADVLVTARSKPFSAATQEIIYGSKPTDNGWLSKITPDEADEIRKTDPIAGNYLRQIVGATELLNNRLRYCLWLANSSATDRVSSPVIKDRVSKVRAMREASDKPQTREAAKRAWEFQENRQPSDDYLVVPLHSSENRDYIPMPLFSSEVVATNAVSFIPNVTLVTFGFVMSSVFVAWAKAVSGRIKNDPRISNTITYNNFPFPDLLDKDKKAIELASQAVLDARASFPDDSLAVLYSRDAMPTELRKAHEALDKAVLNSFGLRTNSTEIGVLEELFNRYAAVVNGLLAAAPEKRTRRR